MHQGKRFLAPLLLVFVLGALLLQLPLLAQQTRDTYEWFIPIQDIRDAIVDGFVEEPDLEALQAGAIRGMIEVLDDPYTEYIPNEAFRDFEKTTGGTYVGIGAEVRMENGWLTIVSPMAGSPAIKSGIRAGDQIRAIDGVTTQGEPIDDSINRLMGEPGSSVTVTVHHQGDPDDVVEEIVIRRDRIIVDTVEGLHREGQNWDYWLDPQQRLAYVRLTQFTQSSYEDLVNALTDLVRQDVRGLIFDLRFNPGGTLTGAIQISDLFLASGTIVAVRDRNGNGQSWDAQAAGTLPDFPVVVLVNGDSASASEIVAGALKDNDRAVILGTRTYGKGKVQDLRDLPGGQGRLKITTAYYYLPSGRNIQRTDDSDVWGVDPTDGYFVPMTNAQYRRMIEIQRELDVIREGNGDGQWNDPVWVEERLADPQLSAAIETLRARVETGQWKETGGTMDDGAQVAAELRRVEQQREFLVTQLERIDEEVNRLTAFVTDEQTDPPVNDLFDSADAADGGVIEIRDEQGNLIGRYRFDDPDGLEISLLRARVRPVEENPDASQN